jgi:hypothetical protein
VLALAAPILYPLFFLLIAYSLSVGNAGTGFRYRTHLVTLAVAAMAVLCEHAKRASEPGDVRVGKPPVLEPSIAARANSAV